MIFGLSTETRSDPEYVRNIAFWVRKLFDMTQYRFESISSSQEIRLTRYVYLVDTTSGVITINLPPAKDAKGEWIKVKLVTGSNKITVDGNGAELIDGSVTHDISVLKECHEFASDGEQWYVVQP